MAERPVTTPVFTYQQGFEDGRRSGYDKGWDDAERGIWEEPVCSSCGCNHDRDESSMCGDGEVVSFREWVDSRRV